MCVLSPNIYGCSLCVCAVMGRRRWSTQQMPLHRLATCASLKCTRRAKTPWVKLPWVITCFANEINGVQCRIDNFTSKSLSRFGIDCFKTALRAKQIQEQNPLVSDNFVEEKHSTAGQGSDRPPEGLSLAPALSLLQTFALGLSLHPSLSLSSSPTWPTLTSAIFTAAWN